MNAPKLSALLVVRNEAEQLADCLSKLKFADEIVVVVDRSSDKSSEIAKKYTHKVLEGSWPIEGDRRNLGIDNCSGDWIIEVDADERVSDSLAKEILSEVGKNTYDYFLLPFDNYIGNRLVRYGWGGSWGVSASVRLFRKGFKKWGRQRIHPKLELRGRKGELESRMAHLVDKNFSDMLERFDRYTYQRSRDLQEVKSKDSLLNNVRRFFSRFFKCYFIRRGYLEGYYGFLIALMAGLYPIISFLRSKLDE
ncbi:glycosyltransferase family 2 protein [Alphaproteobacteria bacterium]|nr:glycosyltransferase family 2 protein [Alphaproteobacteria bacterium]